MIQIKRVYESIGAHDGKRFLVERLWPRGIKKQDLPVDGWLKQAAPSAELRQWFAHDPAKWKEFRTRYSSELRRHTADLTPLVQAARRGNVTLLFSARDTEHNSAVVLKAYLDKKSKPMKSN
jgi:uncharacterized protein YeaO (DUF488 family)